MRKLAFAAVPLAVAVAVAALVLRRERRLAEFRDRALSVLREATPPTPARAGDDDGAIELDGTACVLHVDNLRLETARGHIPSVVIDVDDG